MRCKKRWQFFVTYVDFSKAYDCVPRNKLLHMMKRLGYGFILLFAIAALLSNRTQLSSKLRVRLLFFSWWDDLCHNRWALLLSQVECDECDVRVWWCAPIILAMYKRPVGLSSFVNSPPVVALFLTQRQLSIYAGWQHMGRVPHPNYVDPKCCVATVCHQVRFMYWEHLGHFHRAISHLKWHKIVYMRYLACTFSQMKSTDMFSMYLQSGVPRHFIWWFIAGWT